MYWQRARFILKSVIFFLPHSITFSIHFLSHHMSRSSPRLREYVTRSPCITPCFKQKRLHISVFAIEKHEYLLTSLVKKKKKRIEFFAIEIDISYFVKKGKSIIHVFQIAENSI